MPSITVRQDSPGPQPGVRNVFSGVAIGLGTGNSVQAASQDAASQSSDARQAGMNADRAQVCPAPSDMVGDPVLETVGAGGFMHSFEANPNTDLFVAFQFKDNIETRELPTTAGSLALIENDTGRDAPIVARLRDQGAIILGKTNLSEWANFRSHQSISGWSGVGGQTRNPHSLDRTRCGSAAGSAAAIAVLFAPLADGRFLVGTSKIGPRAVFRPAFSNWRTRIEDVNEFAEVVVELGERMTA